MHAHTPNGAIRDALREAEAERRAGSIKTPRYQIHLDLDRTGDTYTGEVVIEFESDGGDTWLDHTGLSVETFEINGKPASVPEPLEHRLPLPGSMLETKNRVRIRYTNRYDRHGAGFHRFVDPEDGEVYVYTDFEPYCAHRLFPGFDQPDLKAVYQVSVSAPEDWKIIANGAEESRCVDGPGRMRLTFQTLPPFSSYLFAIVAGPYEEVRDRSGPIDMGLFCRKALHPHLDPEEIFEITRQGFEFYEKEFASPYPFGKYDQIFVPEFNSGAMENVAAVTFNESNVFRDPPTETQRLRRAEVILHELAHMWFGNLVTMRWWDGLWLNESFATYISFLAMSEATRFDACWENFLGTIKSWALRQDEKPTTHPIAGAVNDTEETFLNFDGITYGKGAATLKQLRAFLGQDAFRTGLQTYFSRHAYQNTTLEDFLAPLSEASGKDLAPWSKLWLETSGVNSIEPELTLTDGKIERLSLRQKPGNGDAVLRPHVVGVSLFEDRDGRLLAQDTVEVLVDGDTTEVTAAHGRPVPALVWANAGDHAYAKVFLDTHSLETAKARLNDIDDSLVRAGIWLTLWDMTRDGALPPAEFVSIVTAAAPSESMLEVMGNSLQNAYVALYRYSPPDQIVARSAPLFEALHRAIRDAAPDDPRRLLWTRNLISFAMSREHQDILARCLKEKDLHGVPIDQGMRWRILTRLCAHDHPAGKSHLETERERDPSARGVKAHFAASVACPDLKVKEDALAQFAEPRDTSTDILKHGMLAFWWPWQAQLLEPLARKFIDVLPQVLREQDLEYASRGFARYLFPHPVGSAGLETHARELLEKTPDSQAVQKRILLEECDELARVVRLRSL